MSLGRRRTDGVLICGQHARSGQTLQHKPEISFVDKTAAVHCPPDPRGAIWGGVELLELLLKRELPDVRELADALWSAAHAQQEVRCDAELPFNESPTM